MEEKMEGFYKFTQRRIDDIVPEKTALIIVDMQKYQVKKDYSVYKGTNKIVPGLLDYFIEEVENTVIPNLKTMIEFCHQVEIPIIYTKFSSFMPDGSDLSQGKRKLNEIAKNLDNDVAFPHISHPGSDIIDELKPDKRDMILQKNTSGTFMSTRLDTFLTHMEIETVLVAGVVTNFCVHSTAREAVDYGFHTVIIEDCCAAWSPEFHEFILKSFGMLYGYILPHKKVIKKISKMMKKSKKEIDLTIS